MIVYYLDAKNLTKKEIMEELKQFFPDSCPSYSTVCRILQRKRLQIESPPGAKSDKISPSQLIIRAILKALEKQPFASVHELAKLTKIPKSTIYDYLTGIMQMKNKHLTWVPHELDPEMKKNRVELAAELHNELSANLKRKRHITITLDESWFYFEYSYDSIWVQENEKPPTRPKKMISSKKCMLTIVWTRNKILFIDLLPKGVKFCSTYFINNILQRIVHMYKSESRSRQTIIHLHMDNARPHTAKCVKDFCERNGINILPHPAYSPDIAPSDFYLFGDIKLRLKGVSCESGEEVLEKVEKICKAIPQKILQNVFNEWLTRLDWVVKNGGMYYD